MYEGCLKSSWTHLITPGRNFVEVRWRSLFRSTSLGKHRNCMGRDLDCMADVLMGFHRSTFSKPNRIQFRSRSMRFLGFSNHEKRAPTQEISKWSTVCSTFSRSGRSVVRSASLAKGGTSRKRPSSHLHNVPTLSNMLSPRTFQAALVYIH
jgi:hypothetical protein